MSSYAKAAAYALALILAHNVFYDPLLYAMDAVVPAALIAYGGSLTAVHILLLLLERREETVSRLRQIGVATAFAYFALVLFSSFGDITGDAGLSALNPASHPFIVFLCLAGALIALFTPALPQPFIERFHLRGQQLLGWDQAVEKARQELPPELSIPPDAAPEAGGGATFFWGGLHLNTFLASQHFFVTGTTGSGKTRTLRFLMQSVLPGIQKGTRLRALIYDAKQEFYSIVRAINPACPIHILNPLDARCVAWDISKDIPDKQRADDLANVLIPDKPGAKDPFWTNAPRRLLSGVIQAFIEKQPRFWTLRDVLLALRSENIQHVLASCESTRFLVGQYFDNERTAQNVMSTLDAEMGAFDTAAAAWDAAAKDGRLLSLGDWRAEESVLLLGSVASGSAGIEALNRLVFTRLSQLLLDADKPRGSRSFIFLDEVSNMGRLDSLSGLLTQGRSHGACVVLGFQDINGLYRVYGQHETHEILGQCAHKAVLRLENAETAKWASDLFGRPEVMEHRVSTSSQGGETYSQNYAEVLNVNPSEFLDLPPASPKNGIHGYYQTLVTGAYHGKLEGGWVARRQTSPADRSKFPDSVPADPRTLRLRPWDDEDLKRLGLELPRGRKRPTAAARPEGLLDHIRMPSVEWTSHK